MAITQFDYTPSYTVGETEEERRRREEEERLRAQGMAPAPGAIEPVAPVPAAGFGDVVGQYAANRMGQAEQRISDVAGMLADPAAAFAARMNMTPEAAANTEVSSTQVKTYGDGSQEEIVKRQIPAAQTQPVSPEAVAAPAPMAQPMAQPEPAAQPQAAPGQRPLPRNVTIGPDGKLTIGGLGPTPAPAPEVAAAPAPVVAPPAEMAAPAPVMAPQPVAPTPMAAPAMTPPAAMAAPAPAPVSPAEMGAPPVPGPGVQVAGPAQMPPAPAAPAPAAPAVAAPGDFTGQLREIYQDPDRLAAFIGNTANDKAARKVAKDLYIAHETGTYKQDQALRTLEAAATGDPKAANQVMRDLRKEEGSYVKAILFSRLGLNKLAEEEQLKLGGGRQIGQRQVGGDFYTVESDARGAVVRAWDAEGRSQGDKTLSKINAEGVKQAASAATATRIRDASGTEWSQVPTPQGMRFYDNTGKLGVPQGRTVPIAVGSDMELAQQRLDMETIAKFGQQTATERIRAFENTNKLRADRGLPLLSLAEMGLNPDGSIVTEAVRRPGAPAAAPAMAAPAPTPAAAAPARPAAGPVAPSQVAPAAPAVTAQPSISAPAPMAAPAVSPTGTIPTASAMQEQAKEGDLNRAIREAAAKAKINVGQNFEEQKNKIRMSMPNSEQNANRVLATLNDIVTHPGLDKTVGLPRLLATPLEAIPGSDQRAFAQKFKQLGGQEFLAAYDQLRGGGGISEIEGGKAEQAISALKDTGISPKEFRKNMWIFRDAVQSGLDKQRELIGQAPLYRESPQREEAKAWLRNNPNHAKAESVRKMLVGF